MNTENMGEGETLIHRQWECKLGSYKKCVYKQTKFHSLSTKSHHLEKTEIEAEILGSNKISQTEGDEHSMCFSNKCCDAQS